MFPLLWTVDTRKVYDWVFSIYVPIGVGVFVLFSVTIIVFAVLFRRRDRADDQRVRRTRSENNRIEAGYAIVLLGVAILLLSITFRAEHSEDTAMAQERPDLTVDVTASRWEWTFDYRGHGIVHTSGAIGDEPLVVPQNEPVRFNLRSADVIHSFYIPELAFKRDAIPGSTEVITLDFDRRGSFSGSCSEYCGALHADMVFRVRVLGDARFRTWLASGGRVAT